MSPWPPRGVCRAPGRSAFRVAGSDALAFLHRLTTQRIEGLAAGERTRTLLLTTKGHVVADMSLHVQRDGVLCLVDARAAAEAVATLRRYVLRADVRIDPLEAEVAALLGDRATEAPPGTAPQQTGRTEERPHGGTQDPRAATENVLPSPVHSYWREWLLPSGADRSTVLQEGAARSSDARAEVSPERFEAWRIAAGIPRHGAELTGSEFPQEARLEQAVDWDKGCYLGQETVARIHYRGHVNRLLVGLRGESPLAPGVSLLAGSRQVGVVTSAALLPGGEAVALGYVRHEQARPGTELTGSGGVPVRVARPPLAPPAA